MDALMNPTPLLDPSEYIPFVVPEQDSSLIHVILKGYNENRQQPSIFQYLDAGDFGLLRCCITCFVSGQYKVTIEYKGTLNVTIFEGSFEVIHGMPFANKSEVAIPSSASAGVVRFQAHLLDEWENPSPAPEFLSICVQNLKDGSQLSVYAPEYLDQQQVLVYSVAISAAGNYTFSVSMGGVLVKEANCSVQPQAILSPASSQVTGLGAGLPFSYGDANSATPLIAGNTYIVWLFAKDAFGNALDLQAGIQVPLLSADGPGRITYSYLCKDNGVIEYIYSISVSGNYILGIRADTGLFYKGMLQVLPDRVQYNLTVVSITARGLAGGGLAVNLAFIDQFGNAALASGSLLLLARAYGGPGYVSHDVPLHAENNLSTTLNVTRAGMYAVSCYLNGMLLGHETALVEVLPGKPATIQMAAQGLTRDNLTFISQEFSDSFGNPITDPGILQFIGLSVTPSIPWEANMTMSPATGFQTAVWTGQGPQQRSLLVYFQSSYLGTFNWSAYTAPTNMTSQNKISLIQLRIAASVLSVSCLCCSVAFLMSAMYVYVRYV
ncbi:hypothetical protein Agub_g4165 [Astrephomene gubernaculifera]|uniref:Uncharacterized protein n=1 Tax=Astrephomene gubernaculifera TaxID=47775 RepID=A0AAD3HJN2_9CHLO|nr:hypothetical protein Agub_g4165 [Astrephomene gubernaculifera]